MKVIVTKFYSILLDFKSEIFPKSGQFVKDVLVDLEPFAEVGGIELAVLILLLGVNAPGAYDGAEGNHFAGFDSAER